MDLRKITDLLSVAPQIALDDIGELASCGFKTLICNRPDNEDPGQPTAESIAEEAARHGLEFVHQPVVPGGVTVEDIAEFGRLTQQSDSPILAYCRSGTRCSTLWALAEASGERDIDEILDLTASAGYDYSGLKPTLKALRSQKITE